MLSCLPQDPARTNSLSKIRAGRLLGRVHSALGEETLSSSVLDAALDTARTGELLFSESLVVRARALLGRRNSGTPSSGWSEQTGKERLSEIMGRMSGDRGLLQKLLFDSLAD